MKRPILLISLLLLPFTAFSGVSQVGGKWSPEMYTPTLSVQEHYDFGYQALYANDWQTAQQHFMIILYHFAETPFYADSLFYSGIAFYFQGEFDLANRQFDRYLALSGKLKHFEKVFEFKYYIADYYVQGCRKHLFGISSMPRLASGKEDAIEILDEIIATLPGKEIAARALFAKAASLRKQRHYRESIDCLNTLSRRFPKHSLSADSYVAISEIYHEQSKIESQNPDLLSLAKVNISKFSKAFPGDERIMEAEKNMIAMQEVYADSLYETGRFYDRKKKPHASEIYYRDAILKYPATIAAQKCRERLEVR